MDHPCHRLNGTGGGPAPFLKVAGTGLKRARYRVRSPVHEKRRGIGSAGEGAGPPPYHDPPGLPGRPPGGGSGAWWRMGTTPPAAPSSPLPELAAAPSHRRDDGNVRCSFRSSTGGCDPPTGWRKGESSAGQRGRGLQEVSALETPGEILLPEAGIWGCPRHHLPHQFGLTLTGGG